MFERFYFVFVKYCDLLGHAADQFEVTLHAAQVLSQGSHQIHFSFNVVVRDLYREFTFQPLTADSHHFLLHKNYWLALIFGVCVRVFLGFVIILSKNFQKVVAFFGEVYSQIPIV